MIFLLHSILWPVLSFVNLLMYGAFSTSEVIFVFILEKKRVTITRSGLRGLVIVRFFNLVPNLSLLICALWNRKLWNYYNYNNYSNSVESLRLWVWWLFYLHIYLYTYIYISADRYNSFAKSVIEIKMVKIDHFFIIIAF